MSSATPSPSTSAPADRSFVRTLGRVDIFFLGFGSMIGFGWIVLSGGWIGDAGPLGALLAFAIGGTIMALVGLVYSELVSAMPLAGGEHNYLMRGMGPKAALLGSWGIVGGYVTVAMFQSVATPRAAGYLFPWLNQFSLWSVAGTEVYVPWVIIGAAASILLTAMNIRGIRHASLFQTSVMTFLVVVAVVLAVSAVFGGQPANLEPVITGGGGGVIAVLVVVPFLFVGFDVIPQSAEEAKVPPRMIGSLIVVSVIAATVFYIVIVMATAYAAPRDEIAGFDLATADAMSYMLGHPFLGNLVVAGGLAGIVTTWNAFMIGASRLLWAMANSGMIPTWFGKMHPRNGTPVNALLFIGAITTISPFFGVAMLGWAADSGSPSIIITYLMVSIVFLILRRREPQMPRPMRIGRSGSSWGTIVGVAAAATTAAMLALYLPGMPAFLEPEPWLIFALWWALGIAFALRIPGGVKAGPSAEHDLLAKLAAKGRGPRAKG